MCPCEQQFVGGGGVSFFAKDTPETKKLNTDLKARKAQKAEEERQEKIRAMEGVKKKREPYVLNLLDYLTLTCDSTGMHSKTEERLLGKE